MPQLADDITFAIGLAPSLRRASLTALFALDATLGQIVASTTQPLIGQMRLTWWFEALTALEQAARREPVLEAIARDLQPLGVSAGTLATLVQGWEVLLDPLPLGVDVLSTHGLERGEALFAIVGRILDAEPVTGAGATWALGDFACRCSDAVTRARAFELALAAVPDVARLPRPLRVLTRLAACDAAARQRVARSGWAMLRAVR